MFGQPSRLAILILSLAFPAMADEPLRLSYRTYALGAPIAEVEGKIALGPWNYQAELSFRTTGLARLVLAGHHVSAVHGIWRDERPAPVQFDSRSVWRGTQRITAIDYERGMPMIRQLLPPLEPRQEVVGVELRAGSIDSLSALVVLMRTATRTGRCDSTVRTFDGRRAAELVASTIGVETLAPDDRSGFHGPALRCAFVSRMLAGFRLDDADRTDYRPLHGSAWLAAPAPRQPLVPVRMTLETRWFGDVTSYLTRTDGSGRQ